MQPRFASALSTARDSNEALRQCVEGLTDALGGASPDLVALFVTHHHGSALVELGPRIAAEAGAGAVIGCTGESVIGSLREVEQEPALSLWGASLPGTTVRPFQVTALEGPEDEALFSALPPVEDPSRAGLLLVADPYTFPMDAYLLQLNESYPGVPAMGGMASGGHGPGQNLLFTESGVLEGGAAGVVLEGDIELRSVVSQGCRPIGKPWVVTHGDRNVIERLGGRPASEALASTLGDVSPGDRELFGRGPFIGLAVDPNKSEFERGDFLVRGILGLDKQSGSMAVAEYVRRGQTVQFLVRDAESAGEDLEALLRSQGGGELESQGAPFTAGALLFSCNGRGTRMFGTPDHDVTAVRAGLAADVPVAGFFAAGEIGPVCGKNFLHGFTASVAVFRPRR